MKKITKYVAFDGKEFTSERACTDYEDTCKTFHCISVHKDAQRLKADTLPYFHDAYLKARAKYRKALTNRSDYRVILDHLTHLVAIRDRYFDAIANYKKLRQELATIRKFINDSQKPEQSNNTRG